MRIKYIAPGKIEINDKRYRDPVLVSSEGVVFSWEENFHLKREDIAEILKEKPDMLIIAADSDLSSVSPEGQSLLKEKDVILVMDQTNEAINAFNKAKKSNKKILALFPLQELDK